MLSLQETIAVYMIGLAIFFIVIFHFIKMPPQGQSVKARVARRRLSFAKFFGIIVLILTASQILQIMPM